MELDTASSVAGCSAIWADSSSAALDADPLSAGKDVIEALGKGLRIIEAFNHEHARMSASEAGSAAGISRAAARRYLLSLCHFGYADTDGRRFWLAPRVLRLGHSFLDGARIPRLVQPFLDRLSMTSGESATLSVLDDHEVVFLAHSRSPRLASVGHHVGTRVPGHVVAPGYAVMATRCDAEIRDWVARHEFSVYTPNTVACADEFFDEVDCVRRQGYAYNEQQFNMGLNGLSIALQDRKGKCIGALALTMQARSVSRDEAVQRMLPFLVDTKESLRPLL